MMCKIEKQQCYRYQHHLQLPVEKTMISIVLDTTV